jgi:hypothetical protein
MYLDIGVRAAKGTYFRVPHKQLPMTMKEIEKELPNFAKEMDGSAKECTLRYFYKKDKESGIYEFIDIDSEEEVAEIMGVAIIEVAEEDEMDSDGELIKTTALTDQQLARHKENLAEIKRGLQMFDDSSSDSSFDSDSDSDS